MMAVAEQLNEQLLWEHLAEIPDPEIPVINIIELGVVRQVKIDGEAVEVVITPTYSGCPAMKMIEEDIATHLKEKGIENIMVTTVLAPAWTTDWITEEAREKLRGYGIAPPEKPSHDKNVLISGEPRTCPRCSSTQTKIISQFGSTPCKALYKCAECLEPFDYFKCH